MSCSFKPLHSSQRNSELLVSSIPLLTSIYTNIRAVIYYKLFSEYKCVHACRYKLKDAILEGGIPFNLAHDGANVFEYFEKDKHFASLLSEAMDKSIATPMDKLLKMYKGFEGVTKVVDVGGAHGGALSCIVSLNPHVKGINFDLPRVVKDAPKLTGTCITLIHQSYIW